MNSNEPRVSRFFRLVVASCATAGALFSWSGCSSDDDPPPVDAAANAELGDYGAADKPPPDPVELNGPIFVNWPVPKLALVITGQQMGYLEPCGCAGLDNQKGGLSRRHSLLKQLAADQWPVVSVDLGSQVRRYGQQAVIKFQTTAEAIKTLGYSAVGFGADDLRLAAGELVATTTDADCYVSANVGLFGLEAGLTPKYRIVEAAGMRLGITAILGDQLAREVENAEVAVAPAQEALAHVVGELKQKQCDLLVLLSHAPREESESLARKFPDFDVVVTIGKADEPPLALETVNGSDTALVEVGHKGMYTMVLGIYDDAQTPLRYQRVPLDSRFNPSPEIKGLMTSYQDKLRTLGLNGLGLQPKLHPRSSAAGDADGQFASAQACAKCHPATFGVWDRSAHAHATETLTKLDPPRHFDPECLSCHVTGWNPQSYVPYEGGFASLSETPHMQGNGCENCHGPAAAHAAAESGSNKLLRDRLRFAVRVTKEMAEETVCVKCHDLDNSPDFDFNKAWPKIEHKGKM